MGFQSLDTNIYSRALFLSDRMKIFSWNNSWIQKNVLLERNYFELSQLWALNLTSLQVSYCDTNRFSCPRKQISSLWIRTEQRCKENPSECVWTLHTIYANPGAKVQLHRVFCTPARAEKIRTIHLYFTYLATSPSPIFSWIEMKVYHSLVYLVIFINPDTGQN